MQKCNFNIYICIYILISVAENIYCISHAVGWQPDIAFLLKAYAKFIVVYTLMAVIIALLPKILSYLLILLNSLVNIFCITYCFYLEEFPSITSLFDRTDVITSMNVLYYIKIPILFLFLLFATLQILSLSRCSTINFLPAKKRAFLLSIVLMTVIVMISSYGYAKHIDFFRISEKWDFNDNIAHRGVLPVWFAEILHPIPYRGERTCAAGKIHELPIVTEQQPEKIVFIQVESLDYNLLETVNGIPVMPECSNLARHGMLLKIFGEKKAFSSNSDYEVLCTRVSQPPHIAYKKACAYADSIPSLLSKQGYDIKFFHGWDATFQEQAYRLMGGKTFFLHDYKEHGYVPATFTAQQHILDADLFDLALKKAQETEKFFHVVITMNMHDPIEAFDDGLFAKTPFSAVYATARKTDTALAAYIKELPSQTMIIIIGDHVPHHGVRSGFVPAIVAIKGQDLGGKVFPQPYTRCEFSRYLRTLLHIEGVDSSVPVIMEGSQDGIAASQDK